jgi:putative hemolysin
MISRIVLISIAVLGVLLAGLFAGAETGMYRLSRLRLRLGIEKKRFAFVLLGKTLRDSQALLLALLLGTNLAHYLVTSIVTCILLSQFHGEHTAEITATAVTVPIFFVFSELIPKNVFFYRADDLMSFFAPLVYVFLKVFNWCGAVPALKLVSGSFAHLAGAGAGSKTAMVAAQRHPIMSIFADTREEGILSSVQSDIVNRLVRMSHVRIRAVMTPINKVVMAELNSDTAALLSKLKKSPFSRLLVYEGSRANVVGYVNVYEALCSWEQPSEVRKFVKPIQRLGANTTVIEAINTMRTEEQRIVLVIRASGTGRERPIGIVTMKDLVEELVGELAEW